MYCYIKENNDLKQDHVRIVDETSNEDLILNFNVSLLQISSC